MMKKTFCWDAWEQGRAGELAYMVWQGQIGDSMGHDRGGKGLEKRFTRIGGAGLTLVTDGTRSS